MKPLLRVRKSASSWLYLAAHAITLACDAPGSRYTKYNVGPSSNLAQIFGRNRLLWWLPVYGAGPDGDGLHWPTNESDTSRTGNAPNCSLRTSTAAGSESVELVHPGVCFPLLPELRRHRACAANRRGSRSELHPD